MRARWLVVLGAGALVVTLLGGPSSAAPVKKCPKGTVAHITNGTRACTSASRYLRRGTPAPPSAALVRDSLTARSPGLRLRNGKAVPRIVSPRLAARIRKAYPGVESRLAAEVRAEVRAAGQQTSTARSDQVAVTGTTLTRNADGSATGRITMSAAGGGGTIEAVVSLTGRPTGALDIGVDISAANASGGRTTKGVAFRDLLGGKDPKCPSGSGPISVTGGVDATARSEERFGGRGVNLGTVREATTPKITSSARAVIGADGSLQPIAFTVRGSLDYSRSAQVLAFLQSRSRAAATGTMTGTIDPATGKLSGTAVTSSVRSSGFAGDKAAGEASLRAALEKAMADEVARLREKLVTAAKECGPRYEVTLALTTDAEFATHSASGTLDSTLIATPAGAAFTASGPLAYDNLSFVSKISECFYSSPVSVAATWTVTVRRTPTDRLAVTWGTGGNGPRTTATVACPPGFATPGQPGPALIEPAPTTFELPPEGGKQAIGGGFQSGGDGFTNTGTMTVTRRTG